MTKRPAFALDLPRPAGPGRRARRRGRPPFEPLLLETRSAERWTPLGSAALHALILGAVVLLGRLPQAAAKAAPSTSPDHRAITMMYLPAEAKHIEEVKPKPPVRPPERRTPPPPERAEVAPPPLPVPTLPRSNSTTPGLTHEKLPLRRDEDEPVAMARTPGSAARATFESSRDELMVSEARRIFGGRNSDPRAGDDGMLGPRTRAGFPLYLPTGGGLCPSGAPAVPAPDDTSAQGVVVGVVRYASTGTILPGAFLQIVGTPYSTFADDNGHYRLTFDASLVGPCRTQVVRVTAPGYRAQNLILAVGSADNTILMSRR